MRSRAVVVIAAALAGLAACGYRPVAAVALPTAGALYIAPPRAVRSAEPRFAIAYVTALSRELSRRGLPLAATGAAAWRLDTRVLALRARQPAVSRRRVVRRDLALELSVRLHLVAAERGEASTWRSRSLRLRQPWALAGDAAESERSRRASLQRLAERAAQRVAEALADHLSRR